jgi:uncharacterized protein YidB (DUF937 family)
MSALRPSVFDALAADSRAGDTLDARLLADFADQLARPQDGSGLGLLLDDLRDAGFANDVGAWLAPGQSAAPPPLPAGAIARLAERGRVISTTWLDDEAKRNGVDVDTVSRRLAAVIPGAVKALTPRGEVPTPRALLIGLDGLRRKAVR